MTIEISYFYDQLLTKLYEINKSLRSQMIELKDENIKLQNQLMHNEKLSYKNQIACLKKEVQNLTIERDELNDKLYHDLVLDLQRIEEANIEKVQTLEQDNNNLNEQIKELIEQNNKLKKNINDLKKKLDDKEEEFKTIIITEIVDIWRAIKKNSLIGVSYFIKTNTSLLNEHNIDKETPLHYAVERNSAQIVTFLLGSGAEVNNGELHFGQTPLMMACENGSIEIVKKLLDKGADINLQDYINQTALHYAVFGMNIKIVKLLINYGANKNIKDKYQRTPLDYALELNDNRINKIQIINYLSCTHN